MGDTRHVANALQFSSYSCHILSQHVLSLFEKLQKDASHSSRRNYVPLLKACAKCKDAEMGSQLHAAIASKGLEKDVYVGSTLVDMYAKCGNLEKAKEVFDKLPSQDVVSWTALIGGYSRHGCGKEALACFEQMVLAGVLPNPVALVCCLKACGSTGDRFKGLEIHGEIVRRGFSEQDNNLGSALVDMYVKCGLLTRAREVFDKLYNPSIATWTSIITGYVKHEHNEEALESFERMQCLGVSPDAITFVCIVKACSGMRSADKAEQLHVEISRRGLLETNRMLGNALIDMYMNCGSLSKAQEVFDMLPVKDVVSWTTLIGGYAEEGYGEKALELLEHMQSGGVIPNSITFICSLKACTSIGATNKGAKIHEEILKKGMLEKDLTLGNTLVDMYATCGLLSKAQEVFNELLVRDVVTWTALIAGYTKYGHGEEALHLFDQMQCNSIHPDAGTYVCSLKACGSIRAIDKGQSIHDNISKIDWLRSHLVVGNTLVDMYVKCGWLAKAQEVFDKLHVRDTVSWNVLLSGYVNHDRGDEVLNSLKQMQQEGVALDAATFVCGIKACGSLGTMDIGTDLHLVAAKRGYLREDLLVGNAVVDMYASCGLLARAQEVFDELLDHDVVSWTSLIAGYALVGDNDMVLHIFNRMIEYEAPNTITFMLLFTVCSHSGLVDEGNLYFKAMSQDYGLIPTLGHYTCIIDLLGRVGQIGKAMAVIKYMPLHPNLVVWHVVMSACRKNGLVELGKEAFEHALVLDEKEPSTYISISNVFLDANAMSVMAAEK